MKHIPVADIIVARSDAATAEPLPDGLAKKTYDQPLIVRNDFILVDGLRRLLWHKAQGHDQAPVIIVNDFTEALDAVHEQLAGRRPTALWTWNFMSNMDDWVQGWRKNSYRGGWITTPDGGKERGVRPRGKRKETSARAQYKEALNESSNNIQGTVFLYRRAERGDPRAQELVAAINRGEIAVAPAMRQYNKPNNLTGSITNVAEQSRILERGVTGLLAEMNVLAKLGHPLGVPGEEIEEALQGLAEARNKITKLIAGLRNIIKERNG